MFVLLPKKVSSPPAQNLVQGSLPRPLRLPPTPSKLLPEATRRVACSFKDQTVARTSNLEHPGIAKIVISHRSGVKNLQAHRVWQKTTPNGFVVPLCFQFGLEKHPKNLESNCARWGFFESERDSEKPPADSRKPQLDAGKPHTNTPS